MQQILNKEFIKPMYPSGLICNKLPPGEANSVVSASKAAQRAPKMLGFRRLRSPKTRHGECRGERRRGPAPWALPSRSPGTPAGEAAKGRGSSLSEGKEVAWGGRQGGGRQRWIPDETKALSDPARSSPNPGGKAARLSAV